MIEIMRKLITLFNKVFILVLLFFGIFATKNVFAAGTCTCAVNPSSRLVYLLTNNCDPLTEYASGCEGSGNTNPNPVCECVKKEESGLGINQCTCNGNAVLSDNCQGDTPRPNCVSRGYGSTCYCSAETSNRTDGYIAPRPGTPEADEESKSRQSAGVPSCINTALGCVPPDINKFAPWFMQIIFGIAGGIAFLLMVYGFILIATSSGDEKKLQGAKETVTSAITGLLVSIFALFIFKLIAVNILRIPGIN